MSKNIRTYLVYITVAVLIVGLCVAIWVFKFNILFLAVFFLAVGILLFLSIVLLLTKRGKIRELEKGKKLAETVENPWRSKEIAAGVLVYICAVLVAIIFGVIEVIQGNTKFITSIIPIIATLPAVITAFLSPRKCYIYENGIEWRSWFIKWDEIKDFEWKNGVLRIKAKGIRRELLLEDKNGDIRKIVEKMVKK